MGIWQEGNCIFFCQQLCGGMRPPSVMRAGSMGAARGLFHLTKVCVPGSALLRNGNLFIKQLPYSLDVLFQFGVVEFFENR